MEREPGARVPVGVDVVEVVIVVVVDVFAEDEFPKLLISEDDNDNVLECCCCSWAVRLIRLECINDSDDDDDALSNSSYTEYPVENKRTRRLKTVSKG